MLRRDPGGQAILDVVVPDVIPGVSSRIASYVVVAELDVGAAVRVPLVGGVTDLYLVDGSGRLVSRAKGAADLQDVLTGSALAGLADGREFAGSATDPLRGEAKLIASARVGALGWHVVAVSDPSVPDLDTALGQLRALSIGLAFLVLLGGFALARSAHEVLAQRRALGRSNEQLDHANTAKTKFLSSMSHELRTPLNAVIGFSDVLEGGMAGPLNEKQAEYVGDIRTSGRHLLSLINDILDLSKVEAGRLELESTEFSLQETLAGSLNMIRERAAQHGIAVELQAANGADHIVGDERKIKQVVFNLLSNAVKFTPDGGRIAVSAQRVKNEIQLAVQDSGVGIDPADQARIFEEFAQTREGRQASEGTGLGLTLTKRLVELHGGRIWIESEPGRGSTFTFSLPVAAAPVGDG